MPRYKQPCSLALLSLKSLECFVLKVGHKLVREACKPPEERIWDSLKQFLQPCLPHSIANTLTSHLLETIIILAQEVESGSYCYHLEMLDNELCMNVVRKLVEIAIQPRMLALILADFPEFMCEAICKHLSKLTSLRVLKLQVVSTKEYKLAIRQHVECSVSSLKHLKVFHYEKNCTDRILELLAENCMYLEHLNVMFSKHVTDESMVAISKFFNLKVLNVWGTFICGETCAQLLNILSNLETFITDQDNVFLNMDHSLQLNALKTLTSPFESPDLLGKMCPFLSEITFHFVNTDLSQLANLIGLRKLSVSNSSFSFVQTFLQSESNQLDFLKLEEVSDVNLNIICNCGNLKSLEILFCSHSGESRPNDGLATTSTHYQNLEQLTVWGYDSRLIEFMLRSYVSLKTLQLMKVWGLNDEMLMAIVLNNRTTLEVVSLKGCGYLDLDSLKFVVDSCDNISKIVYKSLNVSDYDELPDLYILKVYIERNNIDVEMIIDEDCYF